MRKPSRPEDGRAPFSRDEITHECRRAALALGSFISSFGRNGSMDVAAEYLGTSFEIYEYDEVDEDTLAAIPIQEHFLYRVVMDAYDYAYQVGELGGERVSERLYEVGALLSGFPRTDFDGEPSPFDTLNPQKLRQVLETFTARCNLEAGDGLSIRELALLANMSEAAVRTSLSNEGIRTVAREKGELGQVPHADAVTWLLGRRGFVPTAKLGDFGDLQSQIEHIFGAASLDFPTALNRATSASKIELNQLATKADVDIEWLTAVATPGAPAEADVAALKRLASALSVPIPAFVGRAIADLLGRQLV